MDGFSRDFDPAAIGQAPEAVGGSSKRARNRDSLFLTATLRLDGETDAREVRIRNLSAGGLMAELGRPAAVGTAVTLTLRGIGEVTGRVAWFTEGRAGIALDQPIDPKRARKPVGKGPSTPFYAKAPSHG